MIHLQVQCICGATADDGQPMVACDACNVWQHVHCTSAAPGNGMPWFCAACTKKRAAQEDKQAAQPSSRRRRKQQQSDDEDYTADDVVEILSEDDEVASDLDADLEADAPKGRKGRHSSSSGRGKGSMASQEDAAEAGKQGSSKGRSKGSKDAAEGRKSKSKAAAEQEQQEQQAPSDKQLVKAIRKLLASEAQLQLPSLPLLLWIMLPWQQSSMSMRLTPAWMINHLLVCLLRFAECCSDVIFICMLMMLTAVDAIH